MCNSHELMLEWIDLQRLVKAEATVTGQRLGETKPWSCPGEDVRTAWLRLCRPENLAALKEWLEITRQSGLPTEWDEEAVRCSQGES